MVHIANLVGTIKSLPLYITNCSDVAARVELLYTSKILSAPRGEMIIQPRQKIEAKIEIYPRKVNPDYSKHINVANLLNRENDTLIQITSTNRDKQQVTIHSLFYQLSTTRNTNFIDFGAVVFNSISLRQFTIKNISDSVLKLGVSKSNASEIQLFMKAAKNSDIDITSVDSLAKREKLLESIQSKRSKKGDSAAPSPTISMGTLGTNNQRRSSVLRESSNSDAVPYYLDLASGRESPSRSRVRNVSGIDRKFSQRKQTADIAANTDTGEETDAQMPLERVAALLEAENASTLQSSQPGHEDRRIKKFVFLNRELARFQRDAIIVPCQELSILPQEAVSIFAILKPADVQYHSDYVIIW